MTSLCSNQSHGSDRPHAHRIDLKHTTKERKTEELTRLTADTDGSFLSSVRDVPLVKRHVLAFILLNRLIETSKKKLSLLIYGENMI